MSLYFQEQSQRLFEPKRSGYKPELPILTNGDHHDFVQRLP